MIDLLRRQARSRAAANRRAFVTPNEPEMFLEWKAADMIEYKLEDPESV